MRPGQPVQARSCCRPDRQTEGDQRATAPLAGVNEHDDEGCGDDAGGQQNDAVETHCAIGQGKCDL